MLAGEPNGIAWSADGSKLYVAESGAGQIAEVDPSQGTITRRFITGRYPRGLASADRRKLLLACDWGLDRLAIIDLTDGKEIARIPTGCQPNSVSISPDESIAVVSNLLPNTAATDPAHAAEVTIIDLEKRSVRSTVHLPTGSTNARGIVISGDGKTAYVVHTLGRFPLPTTQLDRGWVNTNALSIIDLRSGTLTATVLLDQMMKGAADPWVVAIDPKGLRLYITLAGVHQLAVIDLDRLPEILTMDRAALANDLSALHRKGLMRIIDLPVKAPRGISVAPGNGRIAIAGYFTGTVVLLDENAGDSKLVPLGPQPKPNAIRRGEIAFHDAGLCFQQWLSCATCHPGARSDGLNWDLLNDGIGNPKNARSMLLSHATPPVMSLGVRSDMETAARAGFIHIQFTQPESGEVEAVSAYLRSLKPEISPYRLPDGSLSEAALRGEKIFHRKSVGCAQCHPAPLFTNLELKDVGTATSLDRGKTKYDVPTLIELWRTPPYLHNGRAATLREVLVEHNPDDDHGNVSSLKPVEIDDLVAYLLSL
jgi:DNA-binding beta-propeller fold protein YncE